MLPYLYCGTSQVSMYTVFNAIAIVAAFITNMLFMNQENLLLSRWCPRICDSRKRAIAVRYTVYWICFLTLLQIAITILFNRLWAQVTQTGFGNYFGNIIFGPPVFALLCLLLRIHPLKQSDLFTPSYIVCLIFFKTACLFHGCCNGKPWAYGFYYILRDRREFPSQLLEILTALLMLFIILRLMKRRSGTGTILPTYIILYSTLRFFTEFTREGDILLLGMQNYQLQCLLGIFIGSIELLLVRKFRPQFDNWFLRRYSPKGPSGL